MAARTFLTGSAFAVLLIALAACGRAGPLEPPPARTPAATAEAGEPGTPANEGRFILDPLIE